jgi:dihydrofolate reductase
MIRMDLEETGRKFSRSFLAKTGRAITFIRIQENQNTMGSIRVFIHVTVDGYFSGPEGEMDWFQSIHDEEWKRFSEENAGSGQSTLMFGHTTYEIMKNFWPTPMAMQMDPKMATVMRNSPKIVFSKTLETPEDDGAWKNVRVFHAVNPREIEALRNKEEIVILGSGTIVQQLTDLGLIDEYMLVVVPVVLGKGRPLFKDVHRKNLKLHDVRHFKSGIVLLTYRSQD